MSAEPRQDDTAGATTLASPVAAGSAQLARPEDGVTGVLVDGGTTSSPYYGSEALVAVKSLPPAAAGVRFTIVESAACSLTQDEVELTGFTLQTHEEQITTDHAAATISEKANR